MADYVAVCFTGPNLPATVLLLLICFYWLFFMLGALGLDLFDLDLDFDGAADSFLSVGFVALRFLNIGELPLMLWLSVFAVSFWTLSMSLSISLDSPASQRDVWMALWLIPRNVAVSVLITKILTQPLRGKFSPVEPYPAEDLIGQEVIVTTGQVTPRDGQARYETEGAPLLLNVRTASETLVKGDYAVIVDFDPTKRTYVVTKSNLNVK